MSDIDVVVLVAAPNAQRAEFLVTEAGTQARVLHYHQNTVVYRTSKEHRPSRARGPSRAAWALVCSLLGSACFYTEVVNEAPVPVIRPLQEGPYFVGDVLRFNATKSVDEFRGTLRTAWQARTCRDLDNPRCTPLGPTVNGAIDTVFEVLITSHQSVEIQLRVTDELDATRLAPALLTVDVGNVPPSVGLQISGNREGISGPYVLYRPIQLAVISGGEGGASLDDDGDAVTLSWRLLPPAASQEDQRSFTQVGDQGYVLIPDVSGQWSVILSAEDGFGGVAEVRRDFFVGQDKPPCLGSLEPEATDLGNYLVETADGPKSFSVLSVVDALDAYPAAPEGDPALGETQFRWLLRTPGSEFFRPIVGHDAANYLVDPRSYQPGDRLELRVEVSDRVSGPERELSCAESVRSCELVAGSECFQRRTWGVQIQ